MPYCFWDAFEEGACGKTEEADEEEEEEEEEEGGAEGREKEERILEQSTRGGILCAMS